MREIKFRAWNSNGKYMIDDSYGDWISFDGRHFTEAFPGYDTPHIEIEKVIGYEIMQFTGLKDKNGKEIYDGDILKYSIENMEDNDKTTYIEEVIFVEGSFDLDGCPLNVCADIGEVIGNIHENPELL